MVGNSLATNVLASAKLYAQLNYALSNAAIASWDSKYYYNAWRPVTAIRREGAWLKSGRVVTNATWEPLLNPTPNHQDYLSTHATFGGAAGAVIRAWNKGDKIDVQLSSNVTIDNVGVITRRYTSIAQAVKDNGDSRIFGGVSNHYQENTFQTRLIGNGRFTSSLLRMRAIVLVIGLVERLLRRLTSIGISSERRWSIKRGQDLGRMPPYSLPSSVDLS